MNRRMAIRLGDVISRARSHRSASEELPVYSVTKHDGFVRSDEYFKKQVFSRDTADYTVVRQGEFAYATIHLDEGSIGYATEDCIVSPMYTAFCIDDALLDRSYFFRLVKSPSMLARYGNLGAGSVHRRRSISLDRFSDLTVDIPPIDEQRRIAAILDKADALRQKRNRAIALLESLTQSIFLDMFGDPAANDRGLPATTLGQLGVAMKYGPRFYNETYSDDGTRIVRITDLSATGELDFDAMPRLPLSDLELAEHRSQPGELLFARTGATVGKIALISDHHPICVPGAYFIRLRFPKAVHPVFAAAQMRSKAIQTIVAAKSGQSAQQNFSGPGLRELPFLVPLMSEQVELARRLALIARQRNQFYSQLVASDNLSTSLQNRAFSGQL